MFNIPTVDLVTTGKNIEKLRKETGLSVKELQNIFGLGTPQAIYKCIACDFSGDVLDGVDRGEEFQKEIFLLRMMRKDYELFNQQLGILDKEETEVFGQF